MKPTLTDKINALTSPMPGTVRLEDVLDLVKDAVVVEVDLEEHPREPENETEREAWAALDTSLNILGVAAVKQGLADLHRAAEAKGHPAMSDEKLFEIIGSVVGHPVGYADLIPKCDDVSRQLAGAFIRLDDEIEAIVSEVIGAG